MDALLTGGKASKQPDFGHVVVKSCGQAFGAQRIGSSGTYQNVKQSFDNLAEGVGFEPTSDASRCRFSRPVPSTARPPLQNLASQAFIAFTGAAHSNQLDSAAKLASA
jgi:hypothetical protein